MAVDRRCATNFHGRQHRPGAVVRRSSITLATSEIWQRKAEQNWTERGDASFQFRRHWPPASVSAIVRHEHMKLQPIPVRLAVSLVVLLTGCFLLLDSMTWGYKVPDPNSGRIRGCYSATEWCLGLSKPSTTVRSIQRWTSVAMMLLAFSH